MTPEELSEKRKLARKATTKRYYERHKAECLERNKKWKRKVGFYSSEKTKESKKAWYARNREKLSVQRKACYDPERIRKWREPHLDKIRAKARAYMARFPHEQKAKIDEAYRERNRESLRARGRAIYAKNPAYYKRNATLRKLRVRGATEVDKSINRMAVYDRDEGLCYLCGLMVDRNKFHLDHKKPLCLGGTHSWENVAVTHPACNQKKNKRLVIPRTQLKLFTG